MPATEDIQAGQRALLADLVEPRENDTDAVKLGLAQRIYRCFSVVETLQICDGRGPHLTALESETARTRVTANFRARHDIRIAGPAPWAILHGIVASTLGAGNESGERRVERSDPAEASRFPTREH